jgi:hypothetical protein
MQYDYYYRVYQERLATLRQEAENERLGQIAQKSEPGFSYQRVSWLDRAAHMLKAGQRLSERSI